MSASPGAAFDLGSAKAVGPALLAYLSERLGVSGLHYQEAPEQISHGWETYIYAFRLAGDGIASAWAAPLILRIYPGEDQAEKAEQEAAVQRFAAEQGYPTPRPLLVETDERRLGRPFMIMERSPGLPLLERVSGDPIASLRAAGTLADAHVALHRLPVEGCPLPSDGPLVERTLDEIRQSAQRFGYRLTDEMERGLVWLEANKGTVIPEETSLCHGDYHPLNLLVDDDGAPTLIDWPGARLGDRHSDVANTLVVLRTAPIDPESFWERFLAFIGRGLFAWLYLRRYRRQLPLDNRRLRYWEAARSFEWRVFVAAMKERGGLAVGAKADTAGRVPEGQGERLRRYFWKRAR